VLLEVHIRLPQPVAATEQQHLHMSKKTQTSSALLLYLRISREERSKSQNLTADCPTCTVLPAAADQPL
jgi:hypothetical protein